MESEIFKKVIQVFGQKDWYRLIPKERELAQMLTAYPQKSEREISKKAGEVYAQREWLSLTLKEKELAKMLEEDGYLLYIAGLGYMQTKK